MLSSLFRPKPSNRLAALRLWVDAVGVFLLHRGDQFRIGNVQGEKAGVDLPLLANLAGEHARLERTGDDWWLEPLASVHCNGQRVAQRTLLQSGQNIRLGSTVQLRFVRPSVLSSTCRLEFVSEHRPAVALDSVILHSEVCVIGPQPDSHLLSPQWPHPVFLIRRGEQLFCKALGGVSRNEAPPQPEVAFEAGDTLCGDWFQFRVEVA